MLTTRVATKGQRTLTGHDVPEELGGIVVAHVPLAQLSDALESHSLRHLRVGVHVVEVVQPLHHGRQQTTVREALGHGEVFLLTAGNGVCIGQHLVHAAVLVAQHALHLFVAKTCRQVDGPVTEAEKELLRLLVAAIEPCVAQTCVHLMQIIERCPRTEIHAEVALLEVAPDALAIGHASHIALAPCRVVLHVGISTNLQLADHVFHASAAFVVTRGSVDGHSRQVVTPHMAVQPVPVGIGLGLRRQACLLIIRCQQAVAVVLQQRLDVQVACLLQRTVQQGYIAERKLLGIQFVLCVATHHYGCHAK